MVKKDRRRVTGYIRKAILAIGIGVCMVGAPTVPSYAAENGTMVLEHPVSDNAFIGVEIQDGGSERAALTRRGVSFATKYDPRLIGGVANHVENQGFTETCWAFSSIAAIECNLIKKGYADASINLSENHLAYFFYNRTADPIGYTAGDKNLNISRGWSQNGGTIQGTALALTTWSGVVNETVSEDDSSGVYKPQELPAQDCYKSDYRVVNTYFFSYDVNTIKQAVMNYGAVATGMWMNWKNYENETYNAYFCPVNPYAKDYIATPQIEGGHAVTIVGWDDNFPKTYFSSTYRGKTYQPQNNGAWIVKNSYGKAEGDEGYIYISYEDASLQEMVSFDMEPASQCYDNNYQYDGTAVPVFLTFPSGTKYANVFKAKGSASGYNETLKAVSVDVFVTNVNYSLQIYTGVTGTSNPTSGKAMFSSPQTGTLTNAGYNQIKLKTPVTLTAGEKYAVVITLSTPNGICPRLGAEKTYNAGWISFVANTGTGQGYVYSNKKWIDAGSVFNLRIKAFTDNTNQKTTYKLNSKTLGISKGSSSTLSLKTTPSSVKRKVTWSSSNKSVATVSSKGKVKAKAYGSTTIKATFVAGSKKKTLTCKVTVGPSKVSGFNVKGSKGKMIARWKGKAPVSGYAIYYSKKKSSGYKKLATITSSNKTSYSKKLSKGTYYVKMCPYLKLNGKTLYGSYTAVKSVKVK